ncbi:MAG: hypothetical protein EZS28_051881, partial [Streblomastix strix]
HNANKQQISTLFTAHAQSHAENMAILLSMIKCSLFELEEAYGNIIKKRSNQIINRAMKKENDDSKKEDKNEIDLTQLEQQIEVVSNLLYQLLELISTDNIISSQTQLFLKSLFFSLDGIKLIETLLIFCIPSDLNCLYQLYNIIKDNYEYISNLNNNNDDDQDNKQKQQQQQSQQTDKQEQLKELNSEDEIDKGWHNAKELLLASWTGEGRENQKKWKEKEKKTKSNKKDSTLYSLKILLKGKNIRNPVAKLMNLTFSVLHELLIDYNEIGNNNLSNISQTQSAQFQSQPNALLYKTSLTSSLPSLLHLLLI